MQLRLVDALGGEIAQTFRYGLVGLLGFGVGYLLYLGLYWWLGSAIGYIWPSVMVFVIWNPAVYFVHARWVFNSPRNESGFWKFQATQALIFLLSPALLWFLVSSQGLPPEIAYLFVLIAFAALGFGLSRFFVFRRTTDICP